MTLGWVRLSGAPSTPEPDGYTPPMHISAYVGSLVAPELGAHGILNASNPHVALGSGVSGAIAEACGGVNYQAVVRTVWEDEFDEPLQPGDCLVTGPGHATAFRWVLHVPAVDYRVRDPETGGSSGPSRVRACTRVALDRAAELAKTHDIKGRFVLGVPLLGAGHGGLGEVASAGAMMEAIQSTPAAASLGCVRFAVLEERLERLVFSAADRYGLAHP